jgi:dTDP-glucose 4,6-dehydratase
MEMVNIPVIGFFEDHAVAIDLVFTKGKPCISNIGGFNEWQNIDLVALLSGWN